MVLGLACLAWGVFLPLLALLVIAGVVQRCLFSAWRYLALLAFAGVACRSCTLPFANALSVLLLARWLGGGFLNTLSQPVDLSSPRSRLPTTKPSHSISDLPW